MGFRILSVSGVCENGICGMCMWWFVLCVCDLGRYVVCCGCEFCVCMYLCVVGCVWCKCIWMVFMCLLCMSEHVVLVWIHTYSIYAENNYNQKKTGILKIQMKCNSILLPPYLPGGMMLIYVLMSNDVPSHSFDWMHCTHSICLALPFPSHVKFSLPLRGEVWEEI